MRSAPAWYAGIVGVFLLMQGVLTGVFQIVDPLDQAFPTLLDTTRMTPEHSTLHAVTGVLALAALRRGGPREQWWFALGFGLFYTALGFGGLGTGEGFGLGLQPFDHGFHLVAGIPGIVAASLAPRGWRLRPAGGQASSR